MQGFWTKIFNIHFLYYLFAILVLFYLLFSLNSSLDKLSKLSSKKIDIENKNKKLSEDIKKLKEEIEYIKNNPSYCLNIAKKEYFYLKPEEYLYVFLSKDRVDAQTLQKKKRNPNRSSEGIKK